MIGVIPGPGELGVVEEFFQLFKTPWEIYRADESYDVVIVANGNVPDVDARLVIHYGSDLTWSDSEAGLSSRARRPNSRILFGSEALPLYGELLTFENSAHRTLCAATDGGIAGVEIASGRTKVLRIGYDLFEEVAFLLTAGQPVEQAQVPTLDLHIGMLRELILNAGVPLVEIPPLPADYDFTVCLTHDIDFVGIRRHKFDHTMWGFLYRATAGAVLDFVRRKISFGRMLRSWKAAVSLPFVYLGWLKDFWVPFDWYLKIEKDLSPTYFFIPFKHRRGEKVTVPHADRRASAYDILDIPEWVGRLQAEGCEVGVHGIDAWHSVDKGRDEMSRVSTVTGEPDLGIRMHWLLRDENTYRVLEQAGYAYDSTAGYNETPGYRCGTTQSFRPLGANTLLELPMHIQDGALFFPGRLGLSDAQAWKRCETFIANAEKLGGVLTVLWHDRSPGPERFWGDFYARLVDALKSRRAWFGTAGRVVWWFRKRRDVSFERVATENGNGRVRICGNGEKITPPLRIRMHLPGASNGNGDGHPHRTVDLSWAGDHDVEPQATVETANGDSGETALANAD